MRSINKEILDLGRAMYDQASGWDEMERDKDGFIKLKPTAAHVDAKMSALTTNIDSLEEKLKKYRAERERTEKITKTEEYKESKKKLSKKKAKKQKATLLEMVFNAADQDEDEDDTDDEDGTYRDKKSGKKKTPTTLETTYGKRFSPVVAMLHDTITEFDAIAADIDKDLKDNRNSSRTMYRSSQISNLISAKNSKLSAVKELAAVAKTLSDLEYKKEKDRQSAEGSGYSKEVASIASKYLRGGLDSFAGSGKKKGKKNKDKDSAKDKKSQSRYRDDDDDDDDPYGTIQKPTERESNQKELAGEFAKTLMKRRDDIHLTPWEKNIQIEGTYHVMVVVDPLNTDDWRFAAISNKTGKEIPDFKDKYKDVLPKKKKCRMVFDLSKNRCTDKNSAKTYKLMYK